MIREPFCLFHEHSGPKAARLVTEAADAYADLAAAIHKLHAHLGDYDLDPVSAETLRIILRKLVEDQIAMDEILAANAPAPVLMAAE